MPKISKLVPGQAPTMMRADVANEVIDYVNGLLQSQGKNGVDVIVESSGKLTISLTGSGVPSGYVEKAGVIVENGVRVSGSILFKES